MLNLSLQMHVIESVLLPPVAGMDDCSCQFSPQRQSKLVPAIQVFGRSNDTQRGGMCLNVHGCYPYIYVACPSDLCTTEEIEDFLITIGGELESKLGEGTVHKIKAVRARSIYGYCEPEQLFLKVLFFAPYLCRRASDLIQSGKVQSRRFRVFESHIPFDLQFAVDHNLYSMGILTANNVISCSNAKMSTCHLEFHVHARDIYNRRQLISFQSGRCNARGRFLKSHLMPSVVDLLDSLGLDSEHNLIDVKLRSSAKPLENNRFTFDYLPSRGGSDLIGQQHVPKAHDIYEEEIDFDSLPESVLFGSPVPPSRNFLADAKSGETSIGSSPLKSPSKRGLPISIASSPSEEKRPKIDGGPVNRPLAQPHLEPFRFSAVASQGISPSTCTAVFTFNQSPPTVSDLLAWAAETQFNWCQADLPFYSEGRHEKPHTIHGRAAEIPQQIIAPFTSELRTSSVYQAGLYLCPVIAPPVHLSKDHSDSPPLLNLTSEPFILTQEEKLSQPLMDQLNKQDDLVLVALEHFAHRNDGKHADPGTDPLDFVVLTVYSKSLPAQTMVIARCDISDYPSYQRVDSELDIFLRVIELVVYVHDCDILVGFEVQRESWGYLQDRFQYICGEDFAQRLSRSTQTRPTNGRSSSAPLQLWEQRKTSSFQVYGRIVLNVWRILKSELALRSYTFESLAKQVLHKIVPVFKPKALTVLFNDPKRRGLVVAYIQTRSRGSIDMLIKTDVLSKSCEFARLFGVDMFSVLTRGSQYKVESLFTRLAHLDNFLLLSPSREDVYKMRAAEQTPLIMEPEGAMYHDPVVVLDFQSLYPSLMIAYNYCFSTCVQRVDDPSETRLGANSVDQLHHQDIRNPYVAVNGAAFVRPNARQGIMPQMQTELLDARLKIKQKLKSSYITNVERKVLDARQAGLKYILNVSYGYTAAAYSGRMPCVEVADAIVGSGRATMHRAIKAIEEDTRWHAKVVYGDTDSLFVLLPGRSREQAFEIGAQIAQAITDQNPAPITLKLEKVYHPCCLMSKKRYVGFKYENAAQRDAIFDAKGIETVRRDSCPLVSDMLQNIIQILYETKDVSRVKAELVEQLSKIVKGARHNLSDFVFARQVKFGTYAGEEREVEAETESSASDDSEKENSDKHPAGKPVARLPPSAHVAKMRQLLDSRDRAEYEERVPYVVINRPGSSRLIDQCIWPEKLYEDASANINSTYYITKQILPALARVLNTINIQPSVWWGQIAKSQLSAERAAISGIGKYFSLADCWFCKGKEGHLATVEYRGFKFQWCNRCSLVSQHLPKLVQAEIIHIQKRLADLRQEARECCWGADPFDDVMKCWSLQCPVFWKSVAMRRKELPRLQQCRLVAEYLETSTS